MSRRQKMPPMIVRNVGDANFKHCAVTLLPFCIEAIRHIKPGDEVDWNTINCIRIAAEVAQAFAAREYGKPRWRHDASGQWTPLFVPATTSVEPEPSPEVEPCGPLFEARPHARLPVLPPGGLPT